MTQLNIVHKQTPNRMIPRKLLWNALIDTGEKNKKITKQKIVHINSNHAMASTLPHRCRSQSSLFRHVYSLLLRPLKTVLILIWVRVFHSKFRSLCAQDNRFGRVHSNEFHRIWNWWDFSPHVSWASGTEEGN
jgi:hypothetical protein